MTDENPTDDELLAAAAAVARHEEHPKVCLTGHLWPNGLAFVYCPVCRTPLRVR